MMLAAILIAASTIASQEASYDGDALQLSGDVALEHSLGTMHAGKAVLTREVEQKEEFPFACVELDNRVELDLAPDGKVSCERAQFDFAALQGRLVGDVLLTDKKGGVPFDVETPQLDLQLVKNPKCTIETATASRGVKITLYEEMGPLTIKADASEIRPSSLQIYGNVTLSSDDLQGIAATLSYDPEKKICILKAEEGKKVLLARKRDELRMSAPEVHITYNPETKLQEVQGVGHVVFSLSAEEETLLNQVYRHAPSTP